MPDLTAGAHHSSAHSAAEDTGRHAADPGPGGAPRARHRAGGAITSRLHADVLCPLAALLAVGLAGARTLRGMPLPDDGALSAPAFRLLRSGSALSPWSPDGLAAVHTAVYATVTRAFQRHETLVGAGRELLLAVTLLSAVLVWRTARRCGLGHPAGAVAVLAFGAVPLLVPAHAVSSPAALGVGWFLLAGWLLAAGSPAPAAVALAGAAGVLAVLLAPDALLLLLIGLAGALVTGQLGARLPPRERLVGAVLLAGAAVAVRTSLGRWHPQPEVPARWGAGDTGLVLVSVVLVVVGVLAARALPRLRPAGIALVATTLLAVAPPSGRLPALLVCLPVAAVLVGALLELTLPDTAGAPGSRPLALRLVAAVGVVVAVVGGGIGWAAQTASDFGAGGRERLVAWAGTQLPTGTRLSADERETAELEHAGADPRQLAAGPDLTVAASTGRAVVLAVVRGDPPPGAAPVARFPAADGLPPLTVADLRPVAPTAEEREHRQVLGRSLAANPETAADDEVRARLGGGEVDPRLLSLLAGLGARYGVGLAGLPPVPGEDDALLVRQAVLAAVGGVPLSPDGESAGRALDWLAAQRAPYTPDIVRWVDGGLLVGYRYLPDPDAELTRAAGG